jgi:hypothetical protein
MPTQCYSVTQPPIETLFAWIRPITRTVPGWAEVIRQYHGPGRAMRELAHALHSRRNRADDRPGLSGLSHRAAEAHGAEDPRLFREPVKW